MRRPACNVCPRFAIVGLALVVVSGCSSNEYVAPPPPEVDVAHPVMQTITRSLYFTGTTEPFDTVAIQARVKGFLKEIKFVEGSDDVQPGDVLFVIDQEPFEVKVRQASAAVELAKAQRMSADAQLESANAERQNAQLQLDRSRAAGGAVTPAEIDALVADLATAEAAINAAEAAQASADSQVLSAQAALDEAQLDLSYTEVTSPIEGRVGRALVDVGNLVGANETTHLTTVVRYDPIYVYYTISESVLLQWIEWQKEGRVEQSPSVEAAKAREVYMGLANEQGYPHLGHFDYADLAVDESSGTYLVRALFDNPDRNIPPGSFVRVRVPLFPEDVLLVDEAVLGRDQAGVYALTVNDEQVVERRAVEVGERHEGMRVVESGLSTDDVIVVNGLQWARPGGKVRANEVPMPQSDAPPDTSPPAETPASDESSPSVSG